MGFSEQFIGVFKRFLPSPFTIAVVLTAVTFILAYLLTDPVGENSDHYLLQIAGFWEKGFWELLTFAMQMLLMLVLGHVMALSKPINQLILTISRYCNNTANAALIVTFLTLLVSFFNWGLGLIFGAVFARKVGEYALQQGHAINYPLVGAAGYSGLMVWHGGLSGSAPIKVNEPNHFLIEQIGQIPLSETIFSSMNIVLSALVLIALPVCMYLLGKKTKPQPFALARTASDEISETPTGAERLDHSKWLGWTFGGLILLFALFKGLQAGDSKVITPNFINLSLFGLGIILHGNFHRFVRAVNTAIVGGAGIALQFPLYAGIMGIMKYSGLVIVFSNFFVAISNETTFPIFTFISAGIVNVFVPSGGGQWGVQGPIIVEAASQLGVSIPKGIMAMAYGDQITNMMQPFWALPLLGITGLKAKEILPYTLYLMAIGVVIFILGLLAF